MKRISTITRISIALASLTLSVVVAAHALGLIPDSDEATLRGRKTLCEAIAIQSSSSISRGDVGRVRASLEAIASRDPQILSAGIRGRDGKLIMQVGSHAEHWKAPPGDTSTPTHIRVPLYQGKQPWGEIELCFRPLNPAGAMGFIRHPLVRLSGFVAGAGAIAYLVYLRRALQYLDPSVVIPDRVKTMLDTLAEGVLVLDTRERIVLANAAFARAVGRAAEDLLGVAVSRLPWVHVAAPNEKGEPDFAWTHALKKGTTKTGLPLCLKPSQKEGGESRTFNTNAAPVLGGKNAIRGALVTFDDVTPIEKKNVQLHQMLEMLKQSRDEINRQNEELQTLAMTDPLTQCLNRRAFFSKFEALWSTARRYAHPLACVMVDVDHFKKVNDRHGHAVGDQVLERVARVLRGLARTSDLVCRYGGEEFCVLLTSTDKEGAERAGERFRKAIEDEKFENLSVTASLGLSWIGANAGSPQGMLNQADAALYEAKRKGRNRVEIWSAATAQAAAQVAQGHPATPPAGAEAPAQADTAAAPAPAATPAPAAAHASGHGESPIAYRAVAALSSVLAHRDKATADHSNRVADLCVATAQGMLPGDDCFLLEVAALLHDIGKLGVPDNILLKPGPLDDSEWQVMRKHERLGSEMVSAALGDERLTVLVRTHHAWFAGNPRNPGMPTRDDIPVGSRILAIADAYDAMVSDRPYRKGRSHEQAAEELRKCAGTQFDPRLVERFLRTMDDRLKAAASGARGPRTATEQALSEVQQQVERLACALDTQDLSLLSALAGRLAASASRGGLGEVAKLASDLESVMAGEPDVIEVLSRVNQLMDLCASASQVPKDAPRALLALPAPPAPPAAPEPAAAAPHSDTSSATGKPENALAS